MSSTDDHNGSGDTTPTEATSDHDRNGPQVETAENVVEELSAKDVYQNDVRDNGAADKWRGLGDLQKLATETGGFIDNERRKAAWPLLLGYTVDDLDEDSGSSAWKSLPPHRDEDQVARDVDRSFIFYPAHENPEEREEDKKSLLNLITRVLRMYPHLSYFQGYHDIAQVIMLSLPPEQHFNALSRLSNLRIRDFMLPSLGPVLTHLKFVPEIILRADPELAHHLGIPFPGTKLLPRSPSAPGPLSFLSALVNLSDASSHDTSVHLAAMQGTLTMYAHDIESLSSIARLFDALLAHEPAFTLYVFAQIVLMRRTHLLEAADDPDMLQYTLQKLPGRHDIDVDVAVAGAAQLMRRFPPERLDAWRSVSRWSVLRTGKAGVESQNIEFAKMCFERQVQELKREEQTKKMVAAVRKYQLHFKSALGAAVVVGVLAIAMRKFPAHGQWVETFVRQTLWWW